VRCAIYTRTSSDERLHQEFNSLEAQRECGEAYIRSQRQAGWTLLPARYDDGGYTGANLERPALKRLLDDIQTKAIDCVVLYKVDRLSRSLFDFARLMQMFTEQGVSFVSVTQQFNSSTPMGRLTLNVLLSFAEFERELVSERTRDKKGAARRKGKWLGGMPMLGYDVDGQSRLQVNEAEAAQVRDIFGMLVGSGSIEVTLAEMAGRGWRQKVWRTRKGKVKGGREFQRGRWSDCCGTWCTGERCSTKESCTQGSRPRLWTRRYGGKRRLCCGGSHRCGAGGESEASAAPKPSPRRGCRRRESVCRGSAG